MTRKTDTEIIKGYWDDSAPWDEPNAVPTDTVDLVGDVRGKRLLELGCGMAECSIAFAKAGAICTGVDICAGRLDHARRLSEEAGVKVELIHDDIQDLQFLNGRTFDIAFSVYSFQYVRDLHRFLAEVHNCLADAGLLVFSCRHPFADCFAKGTLNLTRSYHELDRDEYIDTWQDGSSRPFLRYLRRVSDFHDALVQAGFFIDRVIEEPGWDEPESPDVTPAKLAKFVPTTIVFKALKRTSSCTRTP